MGKKDIKSIGLELTTAEANEIFAILESILRDNTPDGEELSGDTLVSDCLLHNDPELFHERNKAYAEAIEQFNQLQGFPIEAEIETFAEAEDEYTYLAIIASIYNKLRGI